MLKDHNHKYAPVSAGGRNRTLRYGGPLQFNPPPRFFSSWRNGLFCCFGAQDSGLNCFCAHCCCSVCVWSSAYKYAGIPGTDKVVQQRVIAGVLQGAADAQKEANLLGSAALLQAGSDVTNVIASFSAAAFRDLLHERLFGTADTNSVIAHLCCTCCATIQEVDAIQELASGYNVDLRYGECTQCDCCNLYGARVGKGDEITPAPLDNGRKFFKLNAQGMFDQDDNGFKLRNMLKPVQAVPAGVVVQGVPVENV